MGQIWLEFEWETLGSLRDTVYNTVYIRMGDEEREKERII